MTKKKKRSLMTKSRFKSLDSASLDSSKNTSLDSSPVRVKMLADVQNLVSQERNREYGEPGENLGRTAAIMAAYLGDRPGGDFRADDVAAFGIILKLGRLAQNPHKLDSWRDVAGYASIGYEIIEKQQPKKRGRPPKK